MTKFDKIRLTGALVILTYVIGGAVVSKYADKKVKNLPSTVHDKCKIMCCLIDEKFKKHELTEDKWIKLNDEVMDIRWNYIMELNDCLDNDHIKYKGIVYNVKLAKDYTRITKKYTKMINKVGMELNSIDMFEPNKFEKD